MLKLSSQFTGQQIALIVPTKDRPLKIYNFLDSIVKQTISCGRIIIVDGGKSVKDVVMKFKNRLPIEYYECYPPGQIRQRNLAITKLDKNTPLVGYFDDDIVLKSDAIENMLSFWNNCAPETAGVSFNIINVAAERHTFLKGLMGLTGPIQGRVLLSGRNTSIFSVKTDIKTQWLCGGATIWRQEILKKFINQPKDVLWASSEDLNFSYPIGKIYPLYVCAAAQVKHEHVFDHNIKMKYKYYGRTETLWRFYFVETNNELSRLIYLWSQVSTIIARFLMGISSFQIRHFQFAFGQIEGLLIGIYALMKGKNMSHYLDDSIAKKKR